MEQVQIDPTQKEIALRQLADVVEEKEIRYYPSVMRVILGQMK